MFRTDTPRPIKLKDYTPPAYVIDQVNLDFSLHPTATRVKSRLKMRPNPKAGKGKRAKGEPLHLDGEQLKLIEVKLDNRLLGPDDYVVSDMGLAIVDVPDRDFTLDVVTEVNPDKNTELQGLYRSKGIYCTQCEAEGFRRITYFLDRPDVLATYRVRIEADPEEAGVLLSNGNPLERGTIGKRHYAVWTTRTRNPPTCSRWSAATWRRSPPTSRPRQAGTSTSGSTSSPARKHAQTGQWTR